MEKEKVKKIFGKEDWQQVPYKELKVAGIDIWFILALLYIIVWLAFIALPVLNQQLFPVWTKISVLIVSFGAGVPLIVAAYLVQFRKGVK